MSHTRGGISAFRPPWRTTGWRAAAFALCTACVLPPPVSVEDGENHRPFVLTDQAKPNVADVDVDLFCAVCTFEAPIDDDDAQDTLYTRWFFDYDDGDTAKACEQTLKPNGNPRVASCEIDLSARTWKAGAAHHTIELVVTDRPFNDGSANPPHRTLGQGAQETTFRWLINATYRSTSCIDPHNVCKSSQ